MNKELIDLAKKENIDLEIYHSKYSSVEIETLNDELKYYNMSNDNSYKIKAIINNKTITLNYESLKNPKGIIDTIKKHARIIDNDNKNSLCENDYRYDERNDVVINYAKVKEELLKLNEYKEKYPFLENIDSSFCHSKVEVEIENANHKLNDNYGCVNIYINVSGKKDNVVKTKCLDGYYKDFDIKKIREDLDKKIKELDQEFDAKSIKTNKYKIILTNEIAARLLLKMSSMFDAKSIDLKLSLLSDKLNKKVFSDKITILEEPINPKFIVNRHFDSEGTLTYNKEIVKDGVFKLSLNNLEYAYKTNTKPTGNASGIINMHIKEGHKTYDELVDDLNNGIIITNLEGLHAGINHTTGDISLQAQGLLVENKKVVKPLNMIVLSTNIIELFNNVIEIGNDIKICSTSISSPSLLFENITIAGSEE